MSFPPDPPADTSTTDNRPILVTGATGFIGLEVVRRLVAVGRPVRAVFRRHHRAALLAQLPAEMIMADLTSRESLRRAVDGCSAVIHCAGRATFESYDRLRPTLVDGTAALADEAVQAGVERFVFASSLFVHGGDDGPVVDGSSPANPDIDYGRAKVVAETNLAATGFERGALSIRLPHVYGANDLLFSLVRTGWLPWPADPDRSMPHLHVNDAAAAMVAAVDADVQGALPIGDDKSVDWRTFLSVLKTFAPTLRIIEIPPRLTLPVAGVAGRVLGRGRHANMLTADTIRGWNLDLAVESGSLGALGIECLYPSIHEGIPAVLDSAFPFRWRHPVVDRRAV